MFIDKNFENINETFTHNSGKRSFNLLVQTAKTNVPLLFIDCLIEKGIDLEFKEIELYQFENTALTWAIANANNTVALHLIDKCPKEVLNQACGVGAGGMSPLQLIVMKGYKDLDAEDNRLETSNYQLAEAMIKKGVDLNRQDSFGKTPLYYAVLRRDFEMVKLLKNNGATLDKKVVTELLNTKYSKVAEEIKNRTGVCRLSKADFYQFGKKSFGDNIEQQSAIMKLFI